MTTANPRVVEIADLINRLAELLGDTPQRTAPEKPTRPIPQRVLLTPEEAAEALKIGRTTMYALIKNGDIETIQIGRLRRIHTGALGPCIARIAAKKPPV